MNVSATISIGRHLDLGDRELFLEVLPPGLGLERPLGAAQHAAARLMGAERRPVVARRGHGDELRHALAQMVVRRRQRRCERETREERAGEHDPDRGVRRQDDARELGAVERLRNGDLLERRRVVVALRDARDALDADPHRHRLLRACERLVPHEILARELRPEAVVQPGELGRLRLGVDAVRAGGERLKARRVELLRVQADRVDPHVGRARSRRGSSAATCRCRCRPRRRGGRSRRNRGSPPRAARSRTTRCRTCACRRRDPARGRSPRRSWRWSSSTGARTLVLELNVTKAICWPGARCATNARAALIAAWIGAPCMLSLASTTSATPNCAELPALALSGTTETPVTGAPFSVTETWPGFSEAFAGSERTNDLFGNFAARRRDADAAGACTRGDGRDQRERREQRQGQERRAFHLPWATPRSTIAWAF